MFYHCTYCGYEKMVMLPLPPKLCPICGKGTVVQGRAPRGGFMVREGIALTNPDAQGDVRASRVTYADPTARTLDVGPSGTARPLSRVQYFGDDGGAGSRYQNFIQKKTMYVGKFLNFKLEEPAPFAWLNPYTGNKHNRMVFTHIVIAAVARRIQGVHHAAPCLIEPFVGSGQIFLNCLRFGPDLNSGQLLAGSVKGGDLNPYVIAAYQCMQTLGSTFVDKYIEFAEHRDAQIGVDSAYAVALEWLRKSGEKCAASGGDASLLAAMHYVYVVNRCLRGSKLIAGGGVLAKLDPKKALRLQSIRKSERRTLANVVDVLRMSSCAFACQDFKLTCGAATPGDLVIMDCPFPKFSHALPLVLEDRSALGDLEAAGTYGTGDDGPDLQVEIIAQTKKLIEAGTTVILCNYANPSLVLAYRSLIEIAVPQRRRYVFTYQSPATATEAYQLTIVPGAKMDMGPAVDEIITRWKQFGGDDNSADALDQQAYFRTEYDSSEDELSDDESMNEDDL